MVTVTVTVIVTTTVSARPSHQQHPPYPQLVRPSHQQHHPGFSLSQPTSARLVRPRTTTTPTGFWMWHPVLCPARWWVCSAWCSCWSRVWKDEGGNWEDVLLWTMKGLLRTTNCGWEWKCGSHPFVDFELGVRRVFALPTVTGNGI